MRVESIGGKKTANECGYDFCFFSRKKLKRLNVIENRVAEDVLSEHLKSSSHPSEHEKGGYRHGVHCTRRWGEKGARQGQNDFTAGQLIAFSVMASTLLWKDLSLRGLTRVYSPCK